MKSHGVWTLFILGFALTVPLAAAAAAPPPQEKVVADFSVNTQLWQQRQWDANGREQRQPLQTVAATDVVADAAATQLYLQLPLQLPGENEFVVVEPQNWQRWQTLNVELYLPADLPRNVELYIFTKDRDHLWRQFRLELPSARPQTLQVQLPISGSAAAELWQCHGHQRPWHQLTANQLLEFGLRLQPTQHADAAEVYRGNVYVKRVWLSDPGSAWPTLAVSALTAAPHQLKLGQIWEAGFVVEGSFHDPFDAADVAVHASITMPDGEIQSVRGFYYEDFVAASTATAPPQPQGMPRFMLRYGPRQPGVYTAAITITVNGESLPLPPLTFTALPEPGFRGDIQIDRVDPRLLQFANGEPFLALGMNVRSPTDARYQSIVPHSQWEDQGLQLYRQLFARYAANGINFAEVWMSSWWLALEWIPDAPGNHGVGQMNQYRAWMLDRIVESAQEYGIYLVLVFNNHGKFSTWCDQEWQRNPFNKSNGGWLDSPEQYFSDAEAMAAFERAADYIVARWAASPNIMAWKLFTEIDLTGTSNQFFRQPVVAEWHRKAAAYVRSIDPYAHLITTHWCGDYTHINDAIADLPQLDLLTGDAYINPGRGNRHLLELLVGSSQLATRKHKPLQITEFGGSPHGDSMGNLIKQLRLALWAGTCLNLPGPPALWWFALPEEQDLYHHYHSVSAFFAGESRRAMNATVDWRNDENLVAVQLADADSAFIWVADSSYFFSNRENLPAQPLQDVTISVAALAAADYSVVFWNCRTGKVEAELSMSVSEAQPLTLVLPEFREDLAIKIKRK